MRHFCLNLGFPLTDRQLGQFEAFKKDLYFINQTMNLTRVAVEDCEVRHFIDSLLFVDLIPDGAKVLDIGTGPGFPAWPLACARPDLEVHAVDSSGKMLNFLRRHPLKNLVVIEGRAEESGFREEFDVVTGRALTPLAAQLELSAQAAIIGGAVIPMRTSKDLDAIRAFPADELGLELEDIQSRILPGEEVERAFPIFRKKAETHPKYPRTWGEIKKKPIAVISNLP